MKVVQNIIDVGGMQKCTVIIGILQRIALSRIGCWVRELK